MIDIVTNESIQSEWDKNNNNNKTVKEMAVDAFKEYFYPIVYVKNKINKLLNNND
jgi:hypothetical protein